MGGRSVEAFFISCDDHYLAKNLSSIRDEVMAEGEALTNYVRGHIIQRRKWGDGVSLIKSGPASCGVMRRGLRSPIHIAVIQG